MKICLVYDSKKLQHKVRQSAELRYKALRPLMTPFVNSVILQTLQICHVFVTFSFFCTHAYISIPESHRVETCLDLSAFTCSCKSCLFCPRSVFCVCLQCRLVWEPSPRQRTEASWRPPRSDQSRTARVCVRYQAVMEKTHKDKYIRERVNNLLTSQS